MKSSKREMSWRCYKLPKAALVSRYSRQRGNLHAVDEERELALIAPRHIDAVAGLVEPSSLVGTYSLLVWPSR